ncbi:C-type lectin domain family 2 member D3-like [Discoglossus pictus]
MDYYFSEERLNWTSSRDFCLQHGAQLAVLKDKQIKENVKRFFKYSDNYWCGLQRKNGSWYWLGDLQKANEQIDDHTNMDCATMNSANKKYDASNCADPRYFVCIK